MNVIFCEVVDFTGLLTVKIHKLASLPTHHIHNPPFQSTDLTTNLQHTTITVLNVWLFTSVVRAGQLNTMVLTPGSTSQDYWDCWLVYDSSMFSSFQEYVGVYVWMLVTCKSRCDVTEELARTDRNEPAGVNGTYLAGIFMSDGKIYGWYYHRPIVRPGGTVSYRLYCVTIEKSVCSILFSYIYSHCLTFILSHFTLFCFFIFF